VLWIAAQSYGIYQQIDIQGLTPVVHLHLPEEPAYAETVNTTKPTSVNNNSKPAAESVNNNSKPATEVVEVIARQWAWSFRYPNRNITSTELHLPVNQSVRLALQSKDVLHGFYVPEFRVKQDIIPNRVINFTVTPLREGKYRLKDSQFSGTYFALMETNVYVESPQAYNQWLAQAATREPAPANNRAFSEHTKTPEKALKSGWPTVVPAQPPVVNHPS
jgi:cytochrome c oxidase subunit 2